MSTQSIEWHKRREAILADTVERLRIAVTDAFNRYHNERSVLAFYQTQIRKAEARGKNSFDSDRFMIKRKKCGGGEVKK